MTHSKLLIFVHLALISLSIGAAKLPPLAASPLLTGPDGSLDTTFGVSGQFINPTLGTGSAAQYIQADGKIALAGNALISGNQVIAIYRLTATGAFDATFGVGGTVIIPQQQVNSSDFGTGIAVQSNGKIVVVGYSGPMGINNRIVLIRLNSDGSLDATFGTGGIVLLPHLGVGGGDLIGDEAFAVVIQTDGKIVVTGTSDTITHFPHFAVLRFNSNGTLDTTFNGTGFTITDFSGNDSSSDTANAVAFQSDNKIIACGASTALHATSHFALARYNSNGSLDTTFDGTGLVITNFDPINNTTEETAYAVNIQPNGDIIAAGLGETDSTNPALLARYLSNGSLDATFFGGDAIIPGTVITNTGVEDIDEYYALALQADGKIVAAGARSGPNGFTFMLGRYLTTGALDATFNGGGAPAGLVYTSFGAGTVTLDFAVSLQCNGLIVGSGTLTSFDDTTRAGPLDQFVAARYNDSVPLTTVTITSPTGLIFSTTPTFSGTAQNPSIIDLFLDGLPYLSTVTTGSANSWSITAPSPLSLGTHSLLVVERYHDDGHVNCSTTGSFDIVHCPIPVTDPFVVLYDSLYPCR